MVVNVVGVLIVVAAAAATVFACHLSLLCQLTDELLCVVILNPVVVGSHPQPLRIPTSAIP